MEVSVDISALQRDHPLGEQSSASLGLPTTSATAKQQISKSSTPSSVPTSTETVSSSSPTSPSPSTCSHATTTTTASPPAPAAAPLPNLAQEALERLRNKKESSDDEDDDFKPVKKRKVEDNTENLELQTCSICFEPWTNSGSHRIASLKCGHLFGLVCIEKWLRREGNAAKCPQCNLKAKRSDLRVVFAKAVSVQDTTERDHALKELEREKQLRIQAQRDEAQTLLQLNLARSECDRLKEEVERLKTRLEFYTSSSSSSSSSGGSMGSLRGSLAPLEEREPLVRTSGKGGKYYPLDAITVTQNGSARVMAYDAQQGMLVVSKFHSQHSKSGNGIQKFSAADFRHSEYVEVHPGAGTIRDVGFRPGGRDGLLLSAALDKTAKLTSVQSNTVVRSFCLPCPVWACTWDQDDVSYFYCGLQNGNVVTFDIRSPSEPVGVLAKSEGGGGGGSPPITSLVSVPRSAASSLNCAGLLASSLGRCMFWEKSNSSSTTWTPHTLSSSLPEGPCSSVSFEPSTRHCFATFRPTKRLPLVKHVLFQLHNVPTDQPLSCQPVQQFQGGSSQRLLSRSKLLLSPHSQDTLLALYGEEHSRTVHIWDVSSTLELQQLSLGAEPALDMTAFTGSGGLSHLAVLTKSTVHLYKWS